MNNNDRLQPGTHCVITSVNAMYDNYSWCSCSNVARCNSFTGIVVRRSWIDDQSKVAIIDDDNQMLRVIALAQITEINGQPYHHVARKTFKPRTVTISGSKGKSYLLSFDNTNTAVKCSCPGFSFRRTCKHIADNKYHDINN